jgi:hypothetical protein
MAIEFKKFIYGLLLKGESSNPSDNLEGSVWHNSTTNRIMTYINSAIRELISADETQTLTNKSLVDNSTSIVDNSDATKEIDFDAGGTASTKTTITAAQTANRVVTLPDATDTLVGKATTDILTNKRLTTPKINEDVQLTSTATELNQLDGNTVGGSSAGDIVDIDSAQELTNKTLTTPNVNEAVALTSTATELNQLDGNTVGGSSAGDIVDIDSTQELTNKTLTSPNVNEAVALTSTATELNQLDGNTVGGSSAGDIADIDSTQELTNKTLTSPNVNEAVALTSTATELNQLDDVTVGGNTSGDILTTDDTQTITAKDIDGGTASDTLRITLPKNTKANLDGLTRKEGTIVYASDENKLYADNGATLDEIGSAGATALNVTRNGYVHNVGLSYASNILKLVQASGSDFDVNNKGKIGINSVTDGQVVLLEINNANNLFEDDGGTSDIAGEEFGVTTGVAWGEDRPFYLYAVNEDDTSGNLKFAISPNPVLKESPVTANIGYHGNPMATPSDSGMFFLTSSDVTASHDEKPCVLIGGIRMQMSPTGGGGAEDDWTVSALDTSLGDGIRPDPFVGTEFTFPPDQMGANSSTDFFTSANAPTWATPASIVAVYRMHLNGLCHYNFSTRDAGNCTNGADAVQTVMVTPYKMHTATSSATKLSVIGAVLTVAATGAFVGEQTNGSANLELFANGSDEVQNNDFTAAAHDISLDFQFRAFVV